MSLRVLRIALRMSNGGLSLVMTKGIYSDFWFYSLTPVAGSNLHKKRSLDSPTSPQNSNSEETSNLVKWTKLVSADCSFKFSAIYYTYTSGAFLVRFFFEKSRSNIWGIYEITPQAEGMNSVKRISRDLRFPRFEMSQEKFGEWRLCSPSKFDPAAGVRYRWFHSKGSQKMALKGRDEGDFLSVREFDAAFNLIWGGYD